MDLSQWESEIAGRASLRPQPVLAETYLHSWGSFSQPVLLHCEDGEAYVVKTFGVAGRAIYNDQVIGRLGRLIGAPVGDVFLINIPPDIVASEPQLARFAPGVAHGCRWIPGCGDRDNAARFNDNANRKRFGRLAVLYGWVYASDHQVIYSQKDPRLVYSVDHGHFIYGGPNWVGPNLTSAPPAAADQTVCGHAGVSAAEVADATARLRLATNDQIALALAVPPDEWGVPLAERAMLGKYLETRRDQMLASLSAQGVAP